MKQQTATTVPFSAIGQGTKFIGDINTEGDVAIHGDTKGLITITGDLLVGATGVAQAQIHARCAEIAGKVTGNLFIEQKLYLKSTAVIQGDITTGKLSIEEGAVVNGKIMMTLNKTP